MGESVGRVEPETAKKNDRSPCPRYGIIDSQSVKTQYDSEERGIDGAKK